MDQNEVFLTLVYPSATNDYGFQIDDSKMPVTVSHVKPSSPAAKAGLVSGDVLLMVNGHDVTAMEMARILSIISYSQRSPITMKISRRNMSSHGMKESMDVDYKKTIDGAVQTALDAVTFLSDDLDYNYEGTGTIDEYDDDDLSNVRYSGSSQAEILSDLMRAQHGMQDILKNVNQQQRSASSVGEKKKEEQEVFSSEGSIVMGKSAPLKGPSTSLTGLSPFPPPIPPYNPGSPDFFLLSNKPEYKTEVKKQRHYYEEVELHDPEQQQPRITTTSKSNELKDKGNKLLQLVNKHTLPSHPSIELLKTCKGIPASVHAWKKEHVLIWLQKLDLALFNRCKDVFDHHDITGHTLLHLNELKLENMGIRNSDDRIQLGTLIAKLCLTHELSELKELSDQVSWL